MEYINKLRLISVIKRLVSLNPHNEETNIRAETLFQLHGKLLDIPARSVQRTSYTRLHDVVCQPTCANEDAKEVVLSNAVTYMVIKLKSINRST